MSIDINEKDKRLGEALARVRDGLQGLQPAIDAIDVFLNFLGKPLDPEHPEVYDRLNWEDRTGDKGPFQMLRKDSCRDTQLFSHLDALLKANKNNVTVGDWHYWAGNEGFIFRRRKKEAKQ